MPDILVYISQFGVIPLLLILVYYLYNKILDLEKQVVDKNKEIREIEKENVSLLYKCLGAIKKLSK